MPNVEVEGSRSRVTVKVGGRKLAREFSMLSGFIAAQDAAIPAGRTTGVRRLPVRLLTHSSDQRFVSSLKIDGELRDGADELHFILEPIRTYGVQPAQGKRGHEFGPIRLAIFRQLHPFASVICGD
jgi:hypothetical protein